MAGQWDTLNKGVLIVKRDDIAFTQSLRGGGIAYSDLTVQRVNRKRGSGPSL